MNHGYGFVETWGTPLKSHGCHSFSMNQCSHSWDNPGWFGFCELTMSFYIHELHVQVE